MKKPSRIWFYQPEFHWFGWKTLLPWYFGSDEFDRHTIMLGWSVTGRMIIAYRDCPGPPECEKAEPDDYTETEVYD